MSFSASLSNPIRRLAACAVVFSGLAALSTANAGPVTCATTNVKAEGGNGICQEFSGNDQVSSPLTVNEVNGGNGAHGYDDWLYLQKENTPGSLETNVNVGLDVTGNAQLKSGTWSVNTDALDSYADFMIVLKGGNAFVAWFFDNTNVDDGTWQITGNSNLSHLTIYARGQSTTLVPEPATLTLLGLGLLGVSLARKRRG